MSLKYEPVMASGQIDAGGPGGRSSFLGNVFRFETLSCETLSDTFFKKKKNHSFFCKSRMQEAVPQLTPDPSTLQPTPHTLTPKP